jgi:hypothetical protein
MCNVADISIVLRIDQFELPESMDDEEKWEHTNTWTVTYTPYCGGPHTLTINVGDESSKRMIFVYGTPAAGSQIMSGPNGYGAVEGEMVSYKEYSMKVTVKASVWNGVRVRYGGHELKEFAWGRNGRYEIQLKH